MDESRHGDVSQRQERGAAAADDGEATHGAVVSLTCHGFVRLFSSIILTRLLDEQRECRSACDVDQQIGKVQEFLRVEKRSAEEQATSRQPVSDASSMLLLPCVPLPLLLSSCSLADHFFLGSALRRSGANSSATAAQRRGSESRPAVRSRRLAALLTLSSAATSGQQSDATAIQMEQQ